MYAGCQASYLGHDLVPLLPGPCSLRSDQMVAEVGDTGLTPDSSGEGSWDSRAWEVINRPGTLESTRQGNIKCDL